MDCTDRTITYSFNYLDKVKIDILANHLDEDDYQLISDGFNNETDDVKNKISEVFNGNLSIVISKNISMNQELLFNLFDEYEINENRKLLLINNSIENMILIVLESVLNIYREKILMIFLWVKILKLQLMIQMNLFYIY